MSTSITLLDQNFNANDVGIMVFELCVLSPPPPALAIPWGMSVMRHMVQKGNRQKGSRQFFETQRRSRASQRLAKLRTFEETQISNIIRRAKGKGHYC